MRDFVGIYFINGHGIIKADRWRMSYPLQKKQRERHAFGGLISPMDRKIVISTIEPDDTSLWLQMRCQLWPEDSEAEHEQEIEQYYTEQFPNGPWHVLIAKDQEGNPAGFAELSIRPYAEGCKSARVAYLEGWFVVPEFRKFGVGGSLIKTAELWALEQGLSEFASDTDPDNAESIAAHHSLGFRDAGLVHCFIKEL